jgi:archaetidylinositol phosphate synthase
MMFQSVKPIRVNESIFANQERRILTAIAARLPGAIKPDHLTGLGVFAALLVLAAYVLSNWSIEWLWLANFGLVLHWLGDSLDGTLARHRRIERPRYGFYLDQVIDTVGNLAIGLGIGLSPWTRLDCALLVLAVYHMLSVQIFVRTIVDREFHVAVGRLGPTEMRIGIIAMNCAIMAFGAPTLISWPAAMGWPDLMMIALSVGLLGLFGRQMVRHLRRIAAEEPGPAPAPRNRAVSVHSGS